MKCSLSSAVLPLVIMALGCGPAAFDEEADSSNAELRRKKPDAGASTADAGSADASLGDAGSPGALPSPSCGGTAAHHVVLTDRQYRPDDDDLQDFAQGFGQGIWKGSVSFDLGTFGGCTGPSNTTEYGSLRVDDGVGGQTTVGGGPFATHQFSSLTLPVTISPLGACGWEHATASRIVYDTIGTPCLPGGTVRDRLLAEAESGSTVHVLIGRHRDAPPRDGLTVRSSTWLNKELRGSQLTFSARAKFYQNTTAPQCAAIHIVSPYMPQTNPSGPQTLVLTAASPTTAGLLTMTAPLFIQAISTCTGSKLPTPEAADADFELELSPIAVGEPR